MLFLVCLVQAYLSFVSLEEAIQLDVIFVLLRVFPIFDLLFLLLLFNRNVSTFDLSFFGKYISNFFPSL